LIAEDKKRVDQLFSTKSRKIGKVRDQVSISPTFYLYLFSVIPF